MKKRSRIRGSATSQTHSIQLPGSLYKRLVVRRISAFQLLCFCVPLCFLLALPLPAVTLQVAIDGSQAYTSIQSAINASVNGDMVLVHPGRYYENVVLDAKRITLCSLEATTNDSTYIGSTIIDGNNAGSCIRFYNQAQQGSTLRGLTLEHGIGHPFGAQDERHGGGIFVYSNCTVTINNCNIKNNLSTMGGGVFAFESSLTFSGVNIHHNQASASGGGVLLIGSRTVVPNIVFDQANRCSIYENYSTNPCDVYVIDIMANLDFYLDMVSVPNPGDFYFGRHANFTQTQGYTDTVHFVQAYRTEVNQDLYVRPDGDDNNCGLSSDSAMKTIAKAVHKIAADSTNIKTVHILPGTYTSEDQLYPPIPLRSYVNIAGAGHSSTTFTVTSSMEGINNKVISGIKNVSASAEGIGISSLTSGDIHPIMINSTSNHTTISDVLIQDMVVQRRGSMMFHKPTDIKLLNIKVLNVDALEVGAIYSPEWVSGLIVDCEFNNITSVYDDPEREPMTMFDVNVSESITVQNCVFRDFHTAPEQPAFNISNGRSDNNPVDVNISNCLFSNLSSDIYRPIHFFNRSIESFKLSNNTFIINHGWPAAVNLIGNIELQNNIFYNPDCNYELLVIDSPPIVPVSNVYLDYNNIRNGSGGILSNASANIYYSDTNSSQYPIFYSLHSENPLYASLSASSPCINTATPDTTGMGLLPYDLAGNHRVWDGRIDMGCYEYASQPYVSNLDPTELTPGAFFIVSTYPNPFTDQVSIRYKLLKSAQVKIQIYNLKGQVVRTLHNGTQSKGEQALAWEGCDDKGRHVASGIYLLQMKVEGKEKYCRKLVKV
ncbi:MAG: FlgD immunoglobulin-like domain containing protein [Candidatus Cloacimonetes bacterium]|nr:FlgD immunoglobulin-like domain containing protein [Candidatus Cloacimonadota bacterium]